MTAHVYNAIIIANDLNIMVSLNYSTRCLGRCGQTDCPSIHFQFTVVFFCDCTSCAIHRVSFLSTDCFIGTVGRTGKRSNRIRYTAQITMKIYELFSQCEFISWRALRANAREQIVPTIFILSFSLSLSLAPHTVDCAQTNRIVNNFMESKWQLRLFCLYKIQRSGQYS